VPEGITHHNKDVMFKVLSRNYENKSLAVYGLNVPIIKRLLPANYPAVTATEIHADNPFLEEKIDAVNAAVNERNKQIAKNMLAFGDGILKIMQITKLTRAELDELQAT